MSATVRIVVTYGWPHHPTSAVDTPLVAMAVEASAMRAAKGSEVSIVKKNGQGAVARPIEDSENIFNERKVRASGP